HIVDGHRRPFPPEHERDLAADVPARSRYQRDLTRETQIHASPITSLAGSVAGAGHRDALEGGEAPGERAVTAPPRPHLPIDDHAGDTGDVTARYSLEGISRLGGGGCVADDEVGGGASGERSRARGEAERARVVACGERERD